MKKSSRNFEIKDIDDKRRIFIIKKNTNLFELFLKGGIMARDHILFRKKEELIIRTSSNGNESSLNEFVSLKEKRNIIIFTRYSLNSKGSLIVKRERVLKRGSKQFSIYHPMIHEEFPS